MPLLLEGVRTAGPALDVPSLHRGEHGTSARDSTSLEIGILNNMPDAALVATERQFIDLLGAAATHVVVRLRFFSLPGIPRGDAARAHLGTRYADIAALDRLDGLIVTGSEPRAPSLSDEPYWPSLVEVIDWAEHNTRSTIWSCLAAHAAVLHLDGIERRPLATKRSGVFECFRAASDPLLAGVPAPARVSHSRWNDLAERDLGDHGYRVLMRSPEAGVDLFVKRWKSLFVFFQGHPEYDPDSLLREYRRDVGRYLRGERSALPAIPVGYFDPCSEAALLDFERLAGASRDPERAAFPEGLSIRPSLTADWRASALPLFRNWLAILAGHGGCSGTT